MGPMRLYRGGSYCGHALVPHRVTSMYISCRPIAFTDQDQSYKLIFSLCGHSCPGLCMMVTGITGGAGPDLVLHSLPNRARAAGALCVQPGLWRRGGGGLRALPASSRGVQRPLVRASPAVSFVCCSDEAVARSAPMGNPDPSISNPVDSLHDSVLLHGYIPGILWQCA